MTEECKDDGQFIKRYNQKRSPQKIQLHSLHANNISGDLNIHYLQIYNIQIRINIQVSWKEHLMSQHHPTSKIYSLNKLQNCFSITILPLRRRKNVVILIK